MGGVDCGWLRRCVVQSLARLSAPAAAQIEYLRIGRFHHDELALELDDVLEPYLANCQHSKTTGLALRALDHQLDKMSGATNAELWTDEALSDAEEWAAVRRFAARSLAELQEEASTVHELAAGTFDQAPSTSKESAIYGLVLRHTVKVGHGWGKEPSPLKGFYVLDRVINGVEDPAFDERALDDPEAGHPLGRDLIYSLRASVKDVAAISFVPGVRDLVDPHSTETINVRGQRGFVALGPIRESGRRATVGVFFHAGGRWSRSNRYEVVERGGTWGITKFQTLRIS